MNTKHLSFKFALLLSFVLLAIFATTAFAHTASAESPIVRAVLFFSPACGHCEYVRTEIFPSLYEKYGKQLDILEIDITTQDGNLLFSKVLDLFSVPANSRGVPFLVIEENYLVGSLDIPEKFPSLVATELEGDGTVWPKIPGLEDFIEARDAMAAVDPVSSEADSQTVAEDPDPNSETSTDDQNIQSEEQQNNITTFSLDDGEDTPIFIQHFQQDVAGNSIAVVVLLGMIGAVIYTAIVFMRAEELKLWPWWLIPALVLLGIIVAAYLSFVEVSGNDAICGPVGDCNAVQDSPYAMLFGFLHVGVFGILGYITIAIIWAIGRWGREQWQSWANLAMFLLSVFGVLFSIYLTFLEPFVIGATCMWCISSAIIITLLMLNTTPIALQSWIAYDDEYFDEEIEG
jgi:uncharacterized membrane protein/thiol-disulfide isomerase/thioredoxin